MKIHIGFAILNFLLVLLIDDDLSIELVNLNITDCAPVHILLEKISILVVANLENIFQVLTRVLEGWHLVLVVCQHWRLLADVFEVFLGAINKVFLHQTCGVEMLLQLGSPLSDFMLLYAILAIAG